jgi:ribosome biogenesis GTPase / thiamine phosphate phosphatase
MHIEYTNDHAVSDQRIAHRGVVYRKNLGQYHVHSGGCELPCTLSSRLYKPLNYPIPARRPAGLDVREEHAAPVAVGDEVRFVEVGDGAGMIVEVLPRRNQLTRQAVDPGARVFEQVIVSNVDQVMPVFAVASPTPKWGLLDRYLVTAEAAGLPSLICMTKLDLARAEVGLDKMIAAYRRIGYPVLLVSAMTGEGLDELQQSLQCKVSVLAGKSGVGKTSLLNALQPGLGLRVQEVSRIEKGRHTTTHVEMFSLASGGAVVDTPGVREFGLWDMAWDELALFFPEMRPWVGRCKFRLDCHHDEEPGCAIRKAVMAGEISPHRYQSYLRLAEELS